MGVSSSSSWWLSAHLAGYFRTRVSICSHSPMRWTKLRGMQTLSTYTKKRKFILASKVNLGSTGLRLGNYCHPFWAPWFLLRASSLNVCVRIFRNSSFSLIFMSDYSKALMLFLFCILWKSVAAASCKQCGWGNGGIWMSCRPCSTSSLEKVNHDLLVTLLS